MVDVEEKRLQCMEVWGGNEFSDRKFSTHGLDVWIYSLPHAGDENGGDVYYLSSCASGRITRALLADVSGHGDRVAPTAEFLRNLMEKNINHIRQSSLVDQINNDFTQDNTGSKFATALVSTYFLPRKNLAISSAGHHSPFIYRSKLGKWEKLEESLSDSVIQTIPNFPLGVKKDNQYSSVQTKLENGDVVLCFTDGLFEVRDDNGEILGTSGLLDVIRNFNSSDPEVIATKLKSFIQQVSSGNPSDDISVIMMTPNQVKVTLKDNLTAPYFLVRSLWRSMKNKFRSG